MLADSGLRISEALHLRIDQVNFATRIVAIFGGKGGKDSVWHVGAEAARQRKGISYRFATARHGTGRHRTVQDDKAMG